MCGSAPVAHVCVFSCTHVCSTSTHLCVHVYSPFVSSPKVRGRRNDSQMDAGGRKAVLGMRAGHACRNFSLLLTILCLQLTPHEEDAFCENWAEHTLPCLQGTCVKHRGDGCTQTSFSRHLWYDWGAPADKHSAQGGVFILLSRRVFNNKMWPRLFVRQLRCKGASALSGCDAAVWTYASCLFTCTLSPKNKLSSTGICNYKGVRAVLC